MDVRYAQILDKVKDRDEFKRLTYENKRKLIMQLGDKQGKTPNSNMLLSNAGEVAKVAFQIGQGEIGNLPQNMIENPKSFAMGGLPGGQFKSGTQIPSAIKQFVFGGKSSISPDSRAGAEFSEKYLNPQTKVGKITALIGGIAMPSLTGVGMASKAGMLPKIFKSTKPLMKEAELLGSKASAYSEEISNIEKVGLGAKSSDINFAEKAGRVGGEIKTGIQDLISKARSKYGEISETSMKSELNRFDDELQRIGDSGIKDSDIDEWIDEAAYRLDRSGSTHGMPESPAFQILQKKRGVPESQPGSNFVIPEYSESTSVSPQLNKFQLRTGNRVPERLSDTGALTSGEIPTSVSPSKWEQNYQTMTGESIPPKINPTIESASDIKILPIKGKRVAVISPNIKKTQRTSALYGAEKSSTNLESLTGPQAQARIKSISESLTGVAKKHFDDVVREKTASSELGKIRALYSGTMKQIRSADDLETAIKGVASGKFTPEEVSDLISQESKLGTDYIKRADELASRNKLVKNIKTQRGFKRQKEDLVRSQQKQSVSSKLADASQRKTDIEKEIGSIKSARRKAVWGGAATVGTLLGVKKFKRD